MLALHHVQPLSDQSIAQGGHGFLHDSQFPAAAHNADEIAVAAILLRKGLGKPLQLGTVVLEPALFQRHQPQGQLLPIAFDESDIAAVPGNFPFRHKEGAPEVLLLHIRQYILQGRCLGKPAEGQNHRFLRGGQKAVLLSQGSPIGLPQGAVVRRQGRGCQKG